MFLQKAKCHQRVKILSKEPFSSLTFCSVLILSFVIHNYAAWAEKNKGKCVRRMPNNLSLRLFSF